MFCASQKIKGYISGAHGTTLQQPEWSGGIAPQLTWSDAVRVPYSVSCGIQKRDACPCSAFGQVLGAGPLGQSAEKTTRDQLKRGGLEPDATFVSPLRKSAEDLWAKQNHAMGKWFSWPPTLAVGGFLLSIVEAGLGSVVRSN